MPEVDDIDRAIAAAEAETGIERAGAKGLLCAPPVRRRVGRAWTAEEEAFVRENLGRLSDAEIAAKLDRTAVSVEIHWKRELHLPAPSKDPRILTAEQIMWGLGVGCGKSVHWLIDNDVLPGRRLPGDDVTRVVDRQVLLRWMIEPKHWLYFKPENVGSLRAHGKRGLGDGYDFEFWEDARALVLKARAEWKDEWMTPGQVARELGLKWGSRPVNAAIRKGHIEATRWGNWWILRSNLPAQDMRINAQGRIVPKVKPKYECPRGMALHVNLSTCLKARLCREAMLAAAEEYI